MLSGIVFLFSFAYLSVPFITYKSDPESEHLRTLIMSNSDTIRNIIMILIGYYFGSSDRTGNKEHQVESKKEDTGN
jgi:hypothetical protein